jgi:zinc transport system permease protein
MAGTVMLITTITMFEIFTHDFMIRAFLAGLVTAVIAPTIGIFLVTRRYAFLADTLAHVSLAGVAVGFLTGLQPLVTAIVASAGAALWADHLRQSRRIQGESALALFLSGGLALAAVLLSAARNSSISISAVLFGSITTVTVQDLWLITLLGVICLGTVYALWKPLFLTSVDEELAASGGVRVRLLNRVLVLLAAVTVALCLRIVGVLLVGALMVIPVIAAMQLKLGFFKTYLAALAISVLSVVGGLLVSYYFGYASGGTIVLFALGFFGLCSLRSR